MTDHTESNGSPSPEVPEKARRRRFEAGYKLRILAEAERCAVAGQLGELLRREGLYSSHLTSWRKQRDAGALEALAPKQRGRKPKRRDSLALERDRLGRGNRRRTERGPPAGGDIQGQKKET